MLPVWKQSSLTESIFRVMALLMVRSLWRLQQSIMTSSVERKPSEWKRGRCIKKLLFSSFIDSIYRIRNKIMYVLSWKTVSALTRALFWHSFPSLLRNSGNKHQNNPLTSAETVRHPSTDIIFYLITVRWPSLYMVFRYFRCIFNIKPRSI